MGGTKRQFKQLVDKLNKLTSEYGITFGDYSVGESVNFLDLTLSIDEDGFIEYRLYIKPTGSRLNLEASILAMFLHQFLSLRCYELGRGTQLWSVPTRI